MGKNAGSTTEGVERFYTSEETKMKNLYFKESGKVIKRLDVTQEISLTRHSPIFFTICTLNRLGQYLAARRMYLER